MTDHITRLKEALEAYPAGWENLTDAWVCGAEDEDFDFSQAVVGAIDEDEWPAGVIFVDTLNYGAPEAAKPIADYIAAANPAAIRELLERLAAADKDARRYRWLREGHKGCYNTVMIHAGGALDAAVDAAIASQEGGNDA